MAVMIGLSLLLLGVVLAYASLVGRGGTPVSAVWVARPQAWVSLCRGNTVSNTVLPLAPWLNVLNETDVAPCIVLEGARWGVGSSFNMVLWAAARLRQQRPDITLYYDHSPSSYQCSSNKTLQPVLQPGNSLLRTSKPPADCARQTFLGHAHVTEQILMETLGELITETNTRDQVTITSSQQSMEQHLLLNATFQALCPIVMDFWHLAPKLQAQANQIMQQLHSKQRPVIAIHARGGDKQVELSRYVDPNTQQYPMLKGMQWLIRVHLAIRAARPICLLFGDDRKYTEQVRVTAADTLNCSEIVSRTPKAFDSGYNLKEFENLSIEGRCQETAEYLVDIELMGWATVLFANHRANGDTLATYLRKCKYFYDYSSTISGTGAQQFTLWAR